MDVVVTITEFKRHMQAIGYAEATIASYSRDLKQLKKYLLTRKIIDLKKVSHQVILDYQSSVMAESVAMETKALKIRAVKRLFEYLTESHKLLINPTEGIVETSRKNRKIGTVLTLEEIKKLLKQPDITLELQIRDRAIMEVMYSSGIRLDELLYVHIHDVNLGDKTVFVRKGKGKKQRVIPLGKQAAVYLKMYLNKIRPYYAAKNPKERRLFLSCSGRPLDAGAIRAFLRKYKIAAGIEKPVSPHTFRRTCATHFLQQGADIRYVQKLLGHKNLKTTQAYTKVIPVEVKRTHNRTHPGNREDKDED